MKRLLLVAFLGAIGLGYSFAATPSKLVDGKVKFAYATVNGEIAWSAAECEAMESRYSALKGTSTVVVNTVMFPVVSDDVNVSTCITSFTNYSEWSESSNKNVLIKKLVKMKDEYDITTDKMFKQRYEWLLKYYNKLP